VTQQQTGQTLVDMLALNLVVGSGGVLSRAPLRAQSALMMMDAYQPEGVTELAVDSIFMMPQLGILSTVLPEAAPQVFDRDCLIRLGTVVAPVGAARPGEEIATVTFRGKTYPVRAGRIEVQPFGEGEQEEIQVQPTRGINAGSGKGRPHVARAR